MLCSDLIWHYTISGASNRLNFVFGLNLIVLVLVVALYSLKLHHFFTHHVDLPGNEWRLELFELKPGDLSASFLKDLIDGSFSVVQAHQLFHMFFRQVKKRRFIYIRTSH